MHKTKGLITAPLVGFLPDGKVDLDIIARQSAQLSASGVKGAFINGTTGEGLSLTLEERYSVAEKWREVSPEGFRIIVHATCCSVEDSKALVRHASEIGADAYGLLTPLYYRTNNIQDIVSYFTEIATGANGLPFYYYHMPSMSGIALSAYEIIKAISLRIEHFAGLKFTHEDLSDYSACLGLEDGRYDILFGRDELLLESLKLGGEGAVGSTYNFLMPVHLALISAYNQGQMEDATRLQECVRNVIDALADTENFLAACKCLLRETGLDLGGMRSPLRSLSAKEEESLIEKLRALGVFDLDSIVSDSQSA